MKNKVKEKETIKETLIHAPPTSTQLAFSVNSGPNVVYSVNVIAPNLEEAKKGMEFIISKIPPTKESTNLRID